jgi:hypothetical protein
MFINGTHQHLLLVTVLAIMLSLGLTATAFSHDGPWTSKEQVPSQAEWNKAACALDGKIYVIGGTTTSLNANKMVEIYDPQTNSWTESTSLPEIKSGASACVVNGKIYVFGGEKDFRGTGLKEVYEYDPSLDHWTQKKDMPTARFYMNAEAVNGKIYVMGGISHPAAEYAFTVNEEYDPVTDTWLKATELPTLRAGYGSAVVNNKVYLIEGFSSISPAGIPVPTRSVEEYNPAMDLLPLVKNIDVNQCYATPGSDSVCIAVKMRNPAGVTLYAEVQAPDNIPIDSLRLYDDGSHSDGKANDSLYANIWPVASAEEQQYYVDIEVTKGGADTVFHHMNNMASFTTIGPIVLENYTLLNNASPNPGASVAFKLNLTNNGLTATASGVYADITSLDSLAAVKRSSMSFEDIAPGATITSNGSYSAVISQECTPGMEIPFRVDIGCNCFKLWSDTFSIKVTATGIAHENDKRPQTFSLHQNYPNPFNPATTIHYLLATNSHVNITVYNILGEVVSVLVDEFQPAGSHHVVWNAENLASGIYICRLETNGWSIAEKKMLLQK